MIRHYLNPDNSRFFQLLGVVIKSYFKNNGKGVLLSGFRPHTLSKYRMSKKFIFIIYNVVINKLITTLILYRRDSLLLGFLIVRFLKENILTIKIIDYANKCHIVLSGQYFHLCIVCRLFPVLELKYFERRH